MPIIKPHAAEKGQFRPKFYGCRRRVSVCGIGRSGDGRPREPSQTGSSRTQKSPVRAIAQGLLDAVLRAVAEFSDGPLHDDATVASVAIA